MNKALKKLVEKSDAEIASGKLAADEIVRQLFARANSVPTSADILAAARLRRDLGNPPGKNDSLGDAINWESLLAAVPPEQDLHLISADADYASPLDTSVVHAHLAEEWKSHKSAAVHLYPRLSTFFGVHYPDSNLASDLEKDLLIKDLAESSSFRETRSTVARLASYTDFTPQQRQRIADAALNNSQVSLISTDEDVSAFLHKAVLAAPGGPDDWSRSMLEERLSPIELESHEDDNFP